MLDSLQKDGQRGDLSQKWEIGPGQGRVGEDLRPARDGRPGVLLGGNGELGSKHGIGQVIGDAIAMQEGQEPMLQVPRAPGELPRIDGEHDGAIAGSLGTCDQRAA